MDLSHYGLLNDRIVQVHPNKLLGLIGEHEDFPVETLRLSHDRKLLASVSHTDKVHFWDVGFLYEDDGDDGDIDHENPVNMSGSTEMDDAEMDSDDGDSDSDSDHGSTGGRFQGRRVMPTAREKFFEDL